MESSGKTLATLQFKPGDLIAGRYEICERLGAGGMGLVYRVLDRELDNQIVALKLLHSHLAQDETVFRRFRNEVLVARSLSHPNIVRTHDIGRAEDGVSYISMEFIDGLSLKEFLTRIEGPEDDPQEVKIALPFEQAANIFYQILSGMAYAHGKGVIHRDLKPANVMINKAGEVKLADFGTARIVGMDTSITRTGQVVGTPDYMSPEQIRGEKLEPSCDIYSLSIIGYELVTGRRPFAADSPVAVAYKHLNEPLPQFDCPLRDVPPWYQELILKASSKKKSERFATAGEFAHALYERMPELSRQTGYYPAESGRWVTPIPGGTFSGEAPAQEDLLTISQDAATPFPDKTSEATSSVSKTRKVPQGEWTLDFNAHEELTFDSPAAAAEPFKQGAPPAPSRFSASRAAAAACVLLLVCGILAARTSDALQTRARAWLVPGNQQPSGLKQAVAAVLGVETDAADVSEDDVNRLALQRELLELSDPAGGALELPGSVAGGSSKTADAKPPEPPPAETSETSTSASATEAAKSAVSGEPPPPPAKEEPKVEVAAAKIEAPATSERNAAVPDPAPAEPPPPVTGSFMVRKGNQIMAEPSTDVSALRSLRWAATIENLTGGGKKELLSEKLTINVFEPASERVIAKLRPSKVDAADAQPGAKVSGGLEGLSAANPQAGNYRLDLVLDGEVLASKPLSLYVAQVKYSAPAQDADTNGSGSKVSIVRGPAVIGEEPSSVELAREAATQRPSVPTASQEAPPVTERMGPTIREDLAPVNQYNLPSGGLPPARGYEVAAQQPPAQEVAALQPGAPPEEAVAPPAPPAESFSGTMTFASPATETKGVSLSLRFAGSEISGSATISGFSPFQVQGKVYPRGVELELSNSEAQIRFSGARRSQVLKGTFVFAGSQQRGAFQVRSN